MLTYAVDYVVAGKRHTCLVVGWDPNDARGRARWVINKRHGHVTPKIEQVRAATETDLIESFLEGP